jgi:hypothetical protein
MTPTHVSKEGELSDISKEEEEPPPTSSPSHPMNSPLGVREEERCGRIINT